MPVVCVTGRLCSGKTAVVRFLAKRGATTFSADEIIHAYYRDKKSPVYRAVRKAFPEAFDHKGNLVRSRLRVIVLSRREKRCRLERIVHPYIIRDLRKWVASNFAKSGVYIAEIPLLFEKKLDTIFTKVVLVYAPQSILVTRIKKKFGISRQQALGELKLFLPDKHKRRKCDFFIRNTGDKRALKQKAGILWENLKRG